jgi:hypothetical protein
VSKKFSASELSHTFWCETQKNLHRVIQNKSSGMLTSSVVRLHTAARTPALLEHLNWVLYDHLTYRPDLASSDYRLFTYLKNWLGSQRFSNNEDLMKDVKM